MGWVREGRQNWRSNENSYLGGERIRIDLRWRCTILVRPFSDSHASSLWLLRKSRTFSSSSYLLMLSWPQHGLIRVQLCGDCGGWSPYQSPQHASYSHHGLHAGILWFCNLHGIQGKCVWQRLCQNVCQKTPTKATMLTASACLNMSSWIWRKTQLEWDWS